MARAFAISDGSHLYNRRYRTVELSAAPMVSRALQVVGTARRAPHSGRPSQADRVIALGFRLGASAEARNALAKRLIAHIAPQRGPTED
jgi:hypothetical protein